MKERKLGPLGVSGLGLGCIGMSWRYGSADESEALAVLRRYFELGGNFLDTAEIYGPYKDEEPIARFLREVPQMRRTSRCHKNRASTASIRKGFE
jgi:aryl-alcohol dehydrogenase-like predicted oxidoreductase